MIGCFFMSTITVFALFIFSQERNHRGNNFIRLFPPGTLMNPKSLDIKYNSYYIAGGTKYHVYLGNERVARHLIAMNLHSSDTHHISLAIKDLEKLKLKVVKVTVDSPYFYMTDGVTPSALRGSTKNWLADRYMYDSTYFVEAIPISPTSLAIKSLSSKSKEYILGKETVKSPNPKFVPGILQKQIDGIFCVDGKLHYNKELNQLIYLYHYRNQYIVMDTNLNLLYRGNTIDTISRAQISVGKISSENSFTMNSPPLVVNKQSCASGNWLFVHSNLVAKNEDKSTAKYTSVIDVYDLPNKVYKFSFYLYDRDDKKMKSFNVFDKKLVALYDHFVVIYDLNPKYFKNEPI